MATEPNDHTDNIQAADAQATNAWHIVQQLDGHCDICSQSELAQATDSPKAWGPFASRAEAIAKRIGLIRSGKCLPK